MIRKQKRSYGPEPKKFHPANPEKYKGKLPIILRSKLEREFAMWIDRNPYCVSWSSESVAIKYKDPSREYKERRYIIDFTATFRTKSGDLKKFYIEIKPSRECKEPVQSKRKKNQTYLKEKTTYNTNCAKWEAASKFAKRKGAQFKIITERDLHL